MVSQYRFIWDNLEWANEHRLNRRIVLPHIDDMNSKDREYLGWALKYGSRGYLIVEHCPVRLPAVDK